MAFKFEPNINTQSSSFQPRIRKKEAEREKANPLGWWQRIFGDGMFRRVHLLI